MKATRKEKGQVLYLLAIGIITLLGFAGLAIDGGRVYSERRHIQGVTDTSSMTGALYIAQNIESITSGDLVQAKLVAEERAATNGYGATETTVTVTEDPTYYYVETLIQTRVPATISKIVYDSDFGVAAKSMARVKKIHIFALGQAFYSISRSACNAIYNSGNADVTVIGTGIFSNSTCDESNKGAINLKGASSSDIEGNIIAVGGVNIDGSVSSGGVVEGANQDSLENITPPDCSGLANRNDSGSTLQPGIYSGGISLTGNNTKTLEPGLYCLDGDFSVKNGEMTGDGVTFYMRGSARFYINGGDVNLKAPQNDAWFDASGNPWNGLLVIQEYGNTSKLRINGNVDSYFEGTIFVPDAECAINGSGATTALDVQVVCDTIDFLGTADMKIEYNPENKFLPPINIDLVE